MDIYTRVAYIYVFAVSLIETLFMLKRYFITFILFITASISWSQVSVIIDNKSKVEKNIRVYYPSNFKMPIDESLGANDSLKTYDHTLTDNTISVRDYYRYPSKTPILSLDTIVRIYSFNLKAKHEVVVEFRQQKNVPTYGQVFIINNVDTIEIKKHGKVFKKEPKLLPGGSWVYTIK